MTAQASNFDAASFLASTVTDANDTKVVPVPVGEYVAVIEKVDIRPWTSRDGQKSGLALDVIHAIDDSTGALKTLLGRDKITVKQGLMLDTTEQGGLDMGKGRNVSLGKLREATGLNVAGQPFSFLNLVGHVVKINVSHRVDGDSIFADVKGVTKA